MPFEEKQINQSRLDFIETLNNFMAPIRSDNLYTPLQAGTVKQQVEITRAFLNEKEYNFNSQTTANDILNAFFKLGPVFKFLGSHKTFILGQLMNSNPIEPNDIQQVYESRVAVQLLIQINTFYKKLNNPETLAFLSTPEIAARLLKEMQIEVPWLAKKIVKAAMPTHSYHKMTTSLETFQGELKSGLKDNTVKSMQTFIETGAAGEFVQKQLLKSVAHMMEMAFEWFVIMETIEATELFDYLRQFKTAIDKRRSEILREIQDGQEIDPKIIEQINVSLDELLINKIEELCKSNIDQTKQSIDKKEAKTLGGRIAFLRRVSFETEEKIENIHDPLIKAGYKKALISNIIIEENKAVQNLKELLNEETQTLLFHAKNLVASLKYFDVYSIEIKNEISRILDKHLDDDHEWLNGARGEEIIKIELVKTPQSIEDYPSSENSNGSKSTADVISKPTTPSDDGTKLELSSNSGTSDITPIYSSPNSNTSHIVIVENSESRPDTYENTANLILTLNNLAKEKMAIFVAMWDFNDLIIHPALPNEKSTVKNDATMEDFQRKLAECKEQYLRLDATPEVEIDAWDDYLAHKSATLETLKAKFRNSDGNLFNLNRKIKDTEQQIEGLLGEIAALKLEQQSQEAELLAHRLTAKQHVDNANADDMGALKKAAKSAKSWSYLKKFVGIFTTMASAVVLFTPFIYFAVKAPKAYTCDPKFSRIGYALERMGTFGFRRNHTATFNKLALEQAEKRKGLAVEATLKTKELENNVQTTKLGITQKQKLSEDLTTENSSATSQRDTLVQQQVALNTEVQYLESEYQNDLVQVNSLKYHLDVIKKTDTDYNNFDQKQAKLVEADFELSNANTTVDGNHKDTKMYDKSKGNSSSPWNADRLKTAASTLFSKGKKYNLK